MQYTIESRDTRHILCFNQNHPSVKGAARGRGTREGKGLQRASVNDNAPSKNEQPFSTGEAANEEFSLLAKSSLHLKS